jgi:hypothetical protein
MTWATTSLSDLEEGGVGVDTGATDIADEVAIGPVEVVDTAVVAIGWLASEDRKEMRGSTGEEWVTVEGGSDIVVTESMSRTSSGRAFTLVIARAARMDGASMALKGMIRGGQRVEHWCHVSDGTQPYLYVVRRCSLSVKRS